MKHFFLELWESLLTSQRIKFFWPLFSWTTVGFKCNFCFTGIIYSAVFKMCFLLSLWCPSACVCVYVCAWVCTCERVSVCSTPLRKNQESSGFLQNISLNLTWMTFNCSNWRSFSNFTPKITKYWIYSRTVHLIESSTKNNGQIIFIYFVFVHNLYTVQR